MSANLITANPPIYEIKAREHFWVKGLKRPFELSGLIPLYVYVKANHEEMSQNEDYEITIGNATIIFSLNKNTISLITGWVGNRYKK